MAETNGGIKVPGWLFQLLLVVIIGTFGYLIRDVYAKTQAHEVEISVLKQQYESIMTGQNEIKQMLRDHEARSK